MAEELNELRAALQRELESARSGEGGWPENEVAAAFVNRFVVPVLEQAVAREALGWRKIVEQWEQGHQNVVLPYTAALEEEAAESRGRVAYLEARVGELHNTIGELRAESENRLQVGDRLGWQLVEAREEISRLQRQLEFEMYGGDNFSSADALADARPQCAVHPEGGTA